MDVMPEQPEADHLIIQDLQEHEEIIRLLIVQLVLEHDLITQDRR